MSDHNIFQRINAVMKAVEYVQKDVTVSGAGSYKAVSHDMVLAVLRKAMVQNGIVTQVEQLKGKILQMRDKPNGISMHLYSGFYNIHFVNIDKPAEFMTVSLQSHSADSGDKAPGKAHSMAVKYAMLKTFGLETGEQEEGRMAEFTPFTDIQKDEFHSYITNNNDPLGFLCFTKTVGDEAFRALQGTFQSGQISSGKKVANALVTDGFNILKNAAEQVQAHMDNQDTDGLLEIIGEFETPVERKLLGGVLTAEQIKALKSVKELAE